MIDLNEWTYSKIVMEHFRNPHNILSENEKFIPDGEGNVGSLACGDQMYVALQISDGKVKDIRWLTYGCASAIASTSIMSDMVKGMSLEQAYEITPEQIVSALDGLPEHKFHCSVLGDKALRAAIDDYLKKNNLPNPYKAKSVKIICECKNVTDQRIDELVASQEARTFAELQEKTGLGTVCGKCKAKAQDLFAELRHIHGFV